MPEALIENGCLNSVREQKEHFRIFQGKTPMPVKEEGVAGQGFEEMRGPLFEKVLEKQAPFIHLLVYEVALRTVGSFDIEVHFR